MDLNQYQIEAQTTKSDKFFGDRVTIVYFSNALLEAIESLRRLDAIKKSLFYGKSSTLYPVNDEKQSPNCNGLFLDKLNPNVNVALDILHAIIGKATEAGELLEALQNAVIVNRPIDKTNLAIMLSVLQTNFHEVAQRNNAKLKTRFPEKFSSAAAINRDVAKERAVLEDNRHFNAPNKIETK